MHFLSLYVQFRGFITFGIKVLWRLQFLEYLRTLRLKFQGPQTLKKLKLSQYLDTLKSKKRLNHLMYIHTTYLTLKYFAHLEYILVMPFFITETVWWHLVSIASPAFFRVLSYSHIWATCHIIKAKIFKKLLNRLLLLSFLKLAKNKHFLYIFAISFFRGLV